MPGFLVILTIELEQQMAIRSRTLWILGKQKETLNLNQLTMEILISLSNLNLSSLCPALNDQ
jgi:hypothetical protein